MSVITKEVETHWESISPLLSIRDEHEYDLAVERLNELLDEIGTDEGHPLYGLLETLGTLIYAYEEEHYPLPECRGAGALPLLMEEHGLTEAGLPEVGPREVVSEVLSGKRELDVGQIRALAQRFHVSPAVFI